MKKITIFLFFYLFLNNFVAYTQNFIYVGDNSYPASPVQYFSCTECGWNSYQEKLNNISKYQTLEFQTGKGDNQFFVRVSLNIYTSGYLDNKISIFFTNGQRLVLLKTIHREKIDNMHELFFSLTESQVLSLQNNNIAKLQYSTKEMDTQINGYIIEGKTLGLFEAVPYKER